MRYEDFRKKKEELKLSFSQFADIAGYTTDGIKKWKNREEVPKWAGIVLSYIEISRKIKANDL